MQSDSLLTNVQLRRAVPEDADKCGQIFHEAFVGINNKHSFPSEVPTVEWAKSVLTALFSHSGFYCQVAELDEQIVASACQDERSSIAGFGPISVASAAQNRGIGRLLTQSMVARAKQRNFPGLRLLQSTFHNRSLSLYAKSGLDVRELLVTMASIPDRQLASSECVVRPAKERDLEAANEICRRVHGYIRSQELRETVQKGTAFIVEREGKVRGYASGFGYFGHAVAESNTDLKALICAAEEIEGPGIIIPTRNAELFRWCLESGMTVIQPYTLMTIGLYNDPAGA